MAASGYSQDAINAATGGALGPQPTGMAAASTAERGFAGGEPSQQPDINQMAATAGVNADTLMTRINELISEGRDETEIEAILQREF